MIALLGTTDKLSVVTGSAGDVDMYCAYANYDPAQAVNDRVTIGNSFNSITTAVSTDVATAPGTGITRNVKTLAICNTHASVSNLITVNVTNGSTTVEWEKLTLLPGERLSYRDNDGFKMFQADGTEKLSYAPTLGQFFTNRLAADLSNSTTTAAKVTGLDTALSVGVWIFEYFIIYTSSVTTTGIKLGCNHNGTVTNFDYVLYTPTALSTAADGIHDQDVLTATGGLFNVWAARAKTTTAPMISAGVDTINVDMLAQISGIAVVTVAGNLELYHASETANATVVKANSVLRATKIG
jgi:hypothetical protein